VEFLNKVTAGVLDQEVAISLAKSCPLVVKDLEEIMQRDKEGLFPPVRLSNIHGKKYISEIVL
jgi:hypothetical protein